MLRKCSASNAALVASLNCALIFSALIVPISEKGKCTGRLNPVRIVADYNFATDAIWSNVSPLFLSTRCVTFTRAV